MRGDKDGLRGAKDGPRGSQDGFSRTVDNVHAHEQRAHDVRRAVGDGSLAKTEIKFVISPIGPVRRVACGQTVDGPSIWCNANVI